MPRWAAICAAGLLLAWLTGGVAGLLACLVGVALGTLAGLIIKRMARPAPELQAPSLESLEPAAVPVLCSASPKLHAQMRAAIFELTYSGRLALSEYQGELWVQDGDSGVELGEYAQIVEVRISGRLEDGKQKLSSLPGLMTRAHGTCLEQIQAANLEHEKAWSSQRLAQLKLWVGVMLVVVGTALTVALTPWTGSLIGLAAGMSWIGGQSLWKRSGYWMGQATAWRANLQKLEDRLPAPGSQAWSEGLAIALATDNQAIVEQAERRAEVSSDPRVKRLTEAARALS